VSDQPETLGGLPPTTPMSQRMESLLSRAVEDQLSEQRQLAGLLSDIRAQLASLPDHVARAAGTGPDPHVASLAHAVDGVSNDLRTALASLLDRLGAVERRLDALQAASAESEQRLSTHVDEAVLALAEALLRRRRVAAARRDEDLEAADLPAGTEAPDPEEPVAEAPEPPAAEEPVAEAAEPPAAEPPAAETSTAEPYPQPDEPGPSAPPASPAPHTAAHADDAQRKRPWWRPSA
jgi:hypothetical protein